MKYYALDTVINILKKINECYNGADLLHCNFSNAVVEVFRNETGVGFGIKCDTCWPIELRFQ